MFAGLVAIGHPAAFCFKPSSTIGSFDVTVSGAGVLSGLAGAAVAAAAATTTGAALFAPVLELVVGVVSVLEADFASGACTVVMVVTSTFSRTSGAGSGFDVDAKAVGEADSLSGSCAVGSTIVRWTDSGIFSGATRARAVCGSLVSAARIAMVVDGGSASGKADSAGSSGAVGESLTMNAGSRNRTAKGSVLTEYVTTVRGPSLKSCPTGSGASVVTRAVDTRIGAFGSVTGLSGGLSGPVQLTSSPTPLSARIAVVNRALGLLPCWSMRNPLLST